MQKRLTLAGYMVMIDFADSNTFWVEASPAYPILLQSVKLSAVKQLALVGNQVTH
ncbi:MAG: hypothetical protein WA116_02385 [Anaerolineaceae bacterium]